MERCNFFLAVYAPDAGFYHHDIAPPWRGTVRGMDSKLRIEHYARQAFARTSGGHLCDLITGHADGDGYMTGCPDHGYVTTRYQPTARQSRRIRRKNARR